MRAMLLEHPRPGARLALREMPLPRPGSNQVLLRVKACAVCRTDLHVIDGELDGPTLPLIPGHEIVGEVVEVGEHVAAFRPGERVGVPWLGRTCGRCAFCAGGRENLCVAARFTGYHHDGGYAEFAAADARFCFRIPDAFSDAEAAPLLCAGLIGHRAWRLAGPKDAVRRLGLYGFGAAAHLVAQLARHAGQEVFAFTREGDAAAQRFARELGAVWSGASSESSPAPLDAALLFAPVGALVPKALKDVERGGVVVCAGIHMSDIPAFPYRDLWHERTIRSVANLTREDGQTFLPLAAKVPLWTRTEPFPLEAANEAIDRLRAGTIEGAAVLVP